MGWLHYLYPDLFWLAIKYAVPAAIIVAAMVAIAHWVPLGHAEPPPEPPRWEPPTAPRDWSPIYHDDGRREF